MMGMRGAAVLVVTIVAGVATAVTTASAAPPDRMTEGKLAADLGDSRAAEQAFASVAADTTAAGGVRAEALVRLGVVQRSLGKAQASAATFRRAMQSPARDAEVTRLLTLALAGAAPDRARWSTLWPKIALASSAGGRPSIQWPGPGPRGVREAFPVTDPVTLDLEDVSLTALLHHLVVAWRAGDQTWPGPRTSVGFESWPDSYRAPAALDRLDLVIHSGIQGHGVHTDPGAGPRVTVKAAGMPWNELFENILAGNGLGFVLDKNLLFIARAEDLGGFERIRGRTYAGVPVDLHFLFANLLPDEVITGDPRDMQTWKRVPDAGLLGHLAEAWPHCRFVPDPGLRGTATLRVRQLPTMEVLDLFLVANDLAATRVAAPDTPPGVTSLRLCRRGDVRGEPLDLSKLAPPPSPRP